MRTTLDIPAELIDEAQRLLGLRSRSKTVIAALENLIQHGRIDEIKHLMGSLRLDIDLQKSRRRPKRNLAT
jgi:Arc/MetJ family transcription regulator